MHTIHFVGGEVGGVGKSTFCMLLVEAYLLLGKQHVLRDADRTTPNVGWAYDPTHYKKGVTESPKSSIAKKLKKSEDGWQPIYFSEDLDDFSVADTLIDLAQENDLIINLPAQISTVLNKWLGACDLLNSQESLGIRCIYWFVAKAEQRSIDILNDHIKVHGDKMPFVLVQNQVRGTGEKWENLMDEDLAKNLKKSGVIAIEMPELQLSPSERGILDRDNPPLSDLIVGTDKRLGLASKLRCKKFMSSTIDSILATNYLDGSAVVKTEDEAAS